MRGPTVARNILGIVIVEKVPNELSTQFPNPTRKWYSNLKNNLDVLVRSEDLQYEDEVILDQNISVEELR